MESDDPHRRALIDIIEALYPADAEYPDTAAVGQELLRQAKAEALNWRNEPFEVLLLYASKCKAREEQDVRRALRSR